MATKKGTKKSSGARKGGGKGTKKRSAAEGQFTRLPPEEVSEVD